MAKLRFFYREKIVLHPSSRSFTADAKTARWSNRDSDPVPSSQKKWERYHVGGFWIAEGFNVAQMQTPSTAAALELNPGLVVIAMLIGNILVTIGSFQGSGD